LQALRARLLTYNLVYDVASHGFQAWMFPAIGVALTSLGAACVFSPTFRERFLHKTAWRGASLGCFLWVFFLFSLTWTVVAAWATVSQYVALRHASVNRACMEVEGIVSHFVPRRNGRGLEKFRVNGVEFEYADNIFTGGFNQTAERGGPIREGVPVRACYVWRAATQGNVIVRLEIAQE
jgi:hypothetical protein